MRCPPIVLISLSVCLCWALDNASNTSTLKSPVERVFSRRKRWLLFPKGTSMKFTAQIGKRLLAVYPRGFSLSIEAASYYPMPVARIDLIPKRFRPPTTKSPKATGPTPLNLIGIPGSLIKYRVKPATKPPLVQRADQNATNLKWTDSSNSHKWWTYKQPDHFKSSHWSKDKKNYGHRNNLVSERKPHNNAIPYWHRYDRDFEDFSEGHEPQYYEDLEEFYESPHYYNHRTRRDIFSRLEDFKHVLGIDVKTCILRAMCDSKRFLLPPGYSLVQDIMRVVLTFPTINGLKDDYSRIMSADYETCDTYLHHKCPFSILESFVKPKRTL